MAKNVLINGSSYNAVPLIQVPLSGETGNAFFYETSDSDLTASYVLSGHSGYGPNGKVNGTVTVPTISQDGTTHVLTIS